MELYILDSQYRRKLTVDVYHSLIWTERFNAVGDFELVIDAEFIPRELTVDEAYLGLSLSQRVMVAKTSERITEDDGTYRVKITGFSLEHVLFNRPNIQLKPDGTTTLPDNNEVKIAYPFQESMKQLVLTTICDLPPYVPGPTPGVRGQPPQPPGVEPKDFLPGLLEGELNPPGSLPFPDSSSLSPFTRSIESLGATVEALCAQYGLGYAIVKDGDTGKLYFELYTGSDHTSGQADRDAIIFSKGMDNLASTTELRSIAGFYSVALVVAKNGYKFVYMNDDEKALSGVNRKMLYVSATDIDLAAGPDLDKALEDKGRQELAKYRRVHALDGEISTDMYVYGKDYRLGDLVEQRSLTGTSGIFRIVEQIFSSDSEGFKSYPTMQIDTLVTLGSWYSWPFSSFWDTVDGYWQDV